MKKIAQILTVCFFICGSTGLWGVTVSTAQQLENAISNAASGGDKEIVLQDGTYNISDALGVWADGVTVRSQSGKRNNVIIRGQGMYGGVTHIFNVAGTNFTAKDMTIGWVSNHAIQIWGNNNSSNTLLSNLRIVDTYEQMVKISYDSSSSNRSENGIMEYCLLEYTAGVGPQFYIGGIDGHQTKNWIVRNNVFKYISSPSGDIAEHAIHFWSGSEGTLVENNRIIDCDRGIGFGLGSRGHRGGTIRNNMIYHSTTDYGFSDVAIGLENASNVSVYNNTIYMANSYSNAIEYRFSGTSGGIIKNNLCNKAITSRDGGSADTSHNITNARSTWFSSVSSGDLHLASEVPQVVDQGTTISGLISDYDGQSRPQGSGIDIGADEYGDTPAPPPITQTEPFGSFDSPKNGSIVRSSIAVSGWALDNIRVVSVKIYRDPVPGESGLKFIGDADFVKGARPDVELSYPQYPYKDRAGWGYMMLTNFLPNNGNGTFTLYAVARDGSGNETTLGTKTITCDNSNAVKPFGAIDTPTQGGSASGSGFINWGWVLTPQPNKIPFDGTTIDVWVDSVNIGQPTYNIFRADIAGFFPGYANSNGAVGYFYLDTTAYDDGVHSIQWTATDSGGNTDGIGSRYFEIQNGGSRIAKPENNLGQPVGEADRGPGIIYIKKGFHPGKPFHSVYPDERRVIRVELRVLERMEIHLGSVAQGFQVFRGQRRQLPTGSSLDREKGVYSWSPGPGHLGVFRLVFTGESGRMLTRIYITIVP